ncbi:MAG: hypothetical protein ACYDAR_11305 [Thermomicrobiales bacterium]
MSNYPPPPGYPPPPNQPPYPPAGYPPSNTPPQYPPGGYPPAYGGYPPPAQPPKSNRGLILGIGGAILAVLVIAGGIFLVKGRGGTTATATPAQAAVATNASSLIGNLIGGRGQRSGSTATAAPNQRVGMAQAGNTLLGGISATATALAGGGRSAATNTPTNRGAATTVATRAGTTPTSFTTTVQPPPATTAPTQPTTAPATQGSGSGGLTPFTDPENLIKLQYPSSWAPQTLNANDGYNVLKLAASDNTVGLYFDIIEPQEGTLDVEIQGDRDGDAKNTTFTITDGPTTDTKIAGQPAKTYTFSYVRKDNPSATPFTGQVWEMNYNGREYYFNASPVGTHKAEVDALIASITFTTPPATPGQLMTWTDPNGLVKLQYPATWSVSTDSTDSSNVLILTSPDRVYFYIDIIDPQPGSIDLEVQTAQDHRTTDTRFTFKLAAVKDVKIGGEPAKTYTYTYARKDSTTGKMYDGQDWDVNHGGKQYAITAVVIGSHRAEVDAIISSITFTK